MQFIRKFLKFPRIIWFFIPILIIGVFFIFINVPAPTFPITGIDFIGSATFPTGSSFQKTPMGGFSGMTYDAKKQLYYIISDDRSEKAAARFYTLKFDLNNGTLTDGSVVPVGVTTLLNESNQPFPAGSIDPEGIALTNKDTVYISSEGDTRKQIKPFIKQFSISSGKELTTLPISNKFLPDKSGKQGIRNNLAFESLTITPNEKSLFTATENALLQDGSEAQPKIGSHCRILQYNLLTQQLEKEFLYQTESVTPFLNISPRFSSGLTDLVALDNQGHFLSIERTFTGLGFSVALFQISLKGADNIHNINSLLAVDINKIKPIQKKLLLDLRQLDVALDNIEGLTLGSKFPDGQPSLILVSDNNFNTLQRTQILAFKLKIEPPLMRFFRRLIPSFNRS
ncbi:esterase-like activity of phytase family protein [Mastigocladopsis repens]|uniref:esterase-like activity of phytase family protein n=1 Tax=Mastigocladopsis repens TaxID=221287 RepID=UPI0002E3425D|nr:esterase-like activity of phytase family protein [Mastigocladopsis repens]